MKITKSGNIKRVVTFRLSELNIKMLDDIIKDNKKRYNLKGLNRTEMIRIMIEQRYVQTFSAEFKEQAKVIEDFLKAITTKRKKEQKK